MIDNMKVWNAVCQPPETAMKKIAGGRLSGMTDINPQWRYQVMTEQFGMCGVGWQYEIVKLWTEPAPDGQVFAFAQISLSVKVGEDWSDSIPGIGGSMLVAKESAGLHTSDEAYKMAITDALSVAMKMLGVGANVYAGLQDTKYSKPTPKPQEKTEEPTGEPKCTELQSKKIYAVARDKGYEDSLILAMLLRHFEVSARKDLTKKQASEFIQMLERGEGLPEEGLPDELKPDEIPF